MIKAAVSLLLILALAGVQSGPAFRAAVYEHADPSDPNIPLQEIMLNSANTYRLQAEISSELGAHILVFPEYGITGVSVPKTREGIRPYLQVLPSLEPGPTPWIPCFEESTYFNVTILKQLSCAARNNTLVLVVNVATLVECAASKLPHVVSQCPSDGVYQFNTDVAFGADGAVLATYHKINLYREPAFDRPPYPKKHVTTFQTDVANFGLITCFDLLWRDPLIDLVEEHKIRNVVMPTAWVDGLPSLTSVQSQMSWAYGLNITLIAANIQNSKDGYRGSGIYHGRDGFLRYIYGPSNASRLIWADVPSSAESPTSDGQSTAADEFAFSNYSGIIYDDLTNYTFATLDAIEGSAEIQSGNLSCSLQYQFEARVNEGIYVLAGYDGFITLGYGVYRQRIQTCALMWCKDTDHSLCSHPPVTSTSRLLEFELEGNFSTTYIYPSILKANLQLVDATEWSLEVSCDTLDSRVNIGRLITKSGFSHCPLVTSLYGRLYDQD